MLHRLITVMGGLALLAPLANAEEAAAVDKSYEPWHRIICFAAFHKR